MEFNKDEATLAKVMAEIKIEDMDYTEAKVLAMKAQNLDPGLDGISQMLTVLEVYLRAAEKMMTGDIDWYRVLDIHHLADHDTIKKQYRKLSLLLHPDKNTSAGATGAFQLILKAYELLTNKQLRADYDKRNLWMGIPLRAVPSHNGAPSTSTTPPRPSTSTSVPPRPNEQEAPSTTPRGSQPEVPLHASDSSAPTSTSTSFSGFQSVPPRPGKQKAPPATHRGSQPKVPVHAGGSSAAPQPPPKSGNRRSKAPKTSDSPTFWTICSHCRIRFEYNNIYRQRMLRCKECGAAFLGIEIRNPRFSGAEPIPWKRKNKTENQNSADANSSMNTNSEEGPPPESVNADNRKETGSDIPLEKSSTEEEAEGSGGREGDTKKRKFVYYM